MYVIESFIMTCSLFVTNLLHTLHTHTNLLSIQRLCVDNYVFVKFYVDSFCVKDAITKKILLQGTSKNGLYTIQGGIYDFLPPVSTFVTSKHQYIEVYHQCMCTNYTKMKV